MILPQLRDDRAPLKLFLPENPNDPPVDPPRFAAAGDGDERLYWTLRQCYEFYILPKLNKHDRDGTRTQFNNALGHWERLTGNPPICAVTDEFLEAFQAALENEEPRRVYNASINKVFRHLTSILVLMGPRGFRRMYAKNVLPLVPFCEPLTVDAPKKRTLSLEQLDAIYEQCEVATWPELPDILPPVWWRCTIVLDYNWGLRTRDLVRKRLWSDLVPGDPDEVGHSRPGVTYLKFVPKKTRRVKKQPLYLPVSPVVDLHLRALNRSLPAILPSPKNDEAFYDNWKKIQHYAGIRNVFEFKSVRITCNTRLNRVRRRAEQGAGKHVLGHGDSGVNLEWYDQAEEDVYNAIMNMPQPAAFLRGPDTRQLRLF